jgi:hypothetical protein
LFRAGVFYSSITTSTPSDGEYTWNPPATTPSGNDYRIKILSKDNGNIFDLSNADFTIINLTVVMPNGNENWLTNTSQDITWTTDISGNLKIELYKGGIFNTQIIAAIQGSNNLYSWAIPGSTATGSDYKIRITSIDDPVFFDESDENFTIFNGEVIISSPNGGESWQAGETRAITWTDNINENVKIDSTSSDGTYNWDIPFSLESGTDYRVKITSINDPGISDFSDADFTIAGNFITVTSPNGGETWLETDDQVINWIDNLVENVEIQLFRAGVFYSSITTSDYQVKILSVDDGNIFDLSDANFTIISNDLTIVTPNGGENWLTNTTQQIAWTDDILGDVRIDLYKAGVFNSTIVAATASNGSYGWDIPGSVTTGSDYKIRINSVDNPVLFDLSNGSFTIFTGGISVSSPNGGESWQAGETRAITWADNISENVTIDLYKGGALHTVIDPSTTLQ